MGVGWYSYSKRSFFPSKHCCVVWALAVQSTDWVYLMVGTTLELHCISFNRNLVNFMLFSVLLHIVYWKTKRIWRKRVLKKEIKKKQIKKKHKIKQRQQNKIKNRSVSAYILLQQIFFFQSWWIRVGVGEVGVIISNGFKWKHIPSCMFHLACWLIYLVFPYKHFIIRS